jgi:presenilin-like A22 family membrane protease
MAVAIGVFGGLVGASAFPVWVLVCGLLAAAVLDYLAVIETSVMSGAIRASAEFSIPNYIVVPARARVDMDRLRDRLRGEGIVDGPEDVAGVLGLGDLALPSMLVGAVAVEAGDPTALPVVLGVVGAAGSLFVLASFLETSREGGLPALPIIVPGTLAGVGIGLALPTALALVGV